MTANTHSKTGKADLSVLKTVVGIGASAGGLDACRELLSQLPAPAGLAVVLVVHLHPGHESIMAELLAKDSSMPIEQASDGPVRPNRVYVVPPNTTLAMVAGSIKLTPLKTGERLTRIDSFLRSLAADQGKSAVGMILTGMGSDGTLGLRAIKDAGGITIAQAPDTAEHAEMPRSAIADGCVDAILALDAIPAFLLEHIERLKAIESSPPGEEEGVEATLDGICHLLSRELQHDFSQYKRSTLLRRVGRRMVVLGVTSLKQYAALLDSDSGEAHKLLRELLVSVTRFFREPECFEALVPVIRKLVERSGESGLRFWVPACATGEEA